MDNLHSSTFKNTNMVDDKKVLSAQEAVDYAGIKKRHYRTTHRLGKSRELKVQNID